jgi:hypothetical protein
MAQSGKLHSALLILGGILILASNLGKTEVWEGEAIVPPQGFLDWTLAPLLGSRINVAAEIETESGNYTDAVLEILVVDEKEFSYYSGGNIDPSSIPLSRRASVDPEGVTDLRHLVFKITGWHVVLDNEHGVSCSDQEKRAHVHVYVTEPYGFLLYVGSPMLIVGLIPFTRRTKHPADEE